MADGVRNLDKALASISEAWQPHRLTSINDYDVKVVKLQGEFVWHTHPDTDELFLVISGELVIQLRDGDVRLGPGDSMSSAEESSTAPRPSTRWRRCSSSRRAR